MGNFHFKVFSIYLLYSKYPNCQFSFNFYNRKKLSLVKNYYLLKRSGHQ